MGWLVVIRYVNQYACGLSSFIALLVFFVCTLKFLIHYFQNFSTLSIFFSLPIHPSYSPLGGPKKLEYLV